MKISYDDVPSSIFFVLPVQLFLAVLLAAGLILDISELVFFSLLLITAKIFTFLWSLASLEKVRCSITPERYRLFPGDQLNILLNVSNMKILPALIKVELFLHHSLSAHGEASGAETAEGSWINLEKTFMWYEGSEFTIKAFPSRRGVYNLGPPVLTGCDIFYFNRKKKKTDTAAEILVYPAAVKIKKYKLLDRDYFGLHSGISPVKNPLLVSGTRDYQNGAPARSIHWKASARFNRLQAKIFESVRQEKVLIILEVSGFKKSRAKSGSPGSRDNGNFEKMLQVIAAFIHVLHHRGIPSGFVTNGVLNGGGSRIIPFSCSRGHHALVLETLARLKMEEDSGNDITELIKKGNYLSGSAGCICFSDKYSSTAMKISGCLQSGKMRSRFVFAEKKGNDFIPVNAEYLDDIIISGEKT